MNKKNNLKKFLKPISLIVSVLIILVVLYKVFLASFVGGLILIGDKQEIYYDSVIDCISQEMNKGTEGKEKYGYGESLYVYETEDKYIEFFSDSNEYNVWLFIIDKILVDNEMKFKISHCENCVQLSRYEWKNVENVSFFVTENLDEYEYNTEDYMIIPFEIKTVQGKETLYLIIKI